MMELEKKNTTRKRTRPIRENNATLHRFLLLLIVVVALLFVSCLMLELAQKTLSGGNDATVTTAAAGTRSTTPTIADTTTTTGSETTNNPRYFHRHKNDGNSWRKTMFQQLSSSSSIKVEDKERPLAAPDPNLLFWSMFEFSVDAAVQYLGPVDSILRGSEEQSRSNDDDKEPNTSPLDYCHHNEYNHCPPDMDPNQSTTTTTAYRTRVMTFGDSSSMATTTTASNDLQSNSNRNTKIVPSSSSPFSLYQAGDGSAEDIDGIPTRYLEMHHGDRDLAQHSLQRTLQWRHEESIDDLLIQPHRQFDLCKAVYPQYFLGRDPDHGHVLFLQRPALIDMQLSHRNGLTQDALLRHHVYLNEYLWQIVERHSPLATVTNLLDLTGLQWTILARREILVMVQRFVGLMDQHYPQRGYKTLVLNAPPWVQALYQVCSPMMREGTKAKIEIHVVGPRQDAALRQYLSHSAQDGLPDHFWSDRGDTKKQKKADNIVRPRNPSTTIKTTNSNKSEDNEGEDSLAVDNHGDQDTQQSSLAASKRSFQTEMEQELREYVSSRYAEIEISINEKTQRRWTHT